LSWLQGKVSARGKFGSPAIVPRLSAIDTGCVKFLRKRCGSVGAWEL
jgi:hypothetical protein